MKDETVKDVIGALGAQLGRSPRADSKVKKACSLGLPIVVAVPPIVDGQPFPTRYWLSCPLASARIARLEAAGLVKEMSERAASDEAFASSLRDAHTSYAKERDALVPDDAKFRPRGGVAGIQGDGVKCLHAHFAHRAAGGDNPVGAEVEAKIDPLECQQPCVHLQDGEWERNRGWREPKLGSGQTMSETTR